MTNKEPTNLKVIIPIITASITIVSFLTTIAIKPIVSLYSRVEVLEQRVNNRKNDIKNLYCALDKIDLRITNNNKQLYNSTSDLKERIAKMEGYTIEERKQCK